MTTNGWKSVTLGLHKTAEDYRVALKKAGFRIGDHGGILERMPIAKEECEVPLVIRTVAELGITVAMRYDAIFARAMQLGFDLCPAEVGPALRLAYADQPIGECLVVAMDPMITRDGYSSVFHLLRGEDVRWLSAPCSYPGYCWDPNYSFVFMTRTKVG